MWGGQSGGLSQAGVKDLYLIAPSTIFAIGSPACSWRSGRFRGAREGRAQQPASQDARRPQIVGHLLLIGSRLPPPKDFRPAERPELAAAFEAAGDTAAQVILIPPA